ncbi:MAG: hypothetical protein R3C53_03430 [Pirellulaceae bacterium]
MKNLESLILAAVAMAICAFCSYQYARFLSPHTQHSAGWIDPNQDVMNLMRVQDLPDKCTGARYASSTVGIESLTAVALMGATGDLEDFAIRVIPKANSVEVFGISTKCPFTAVQIRELERLYRVDLSWIPTQSREDCIAIETVGQSVGNPYLYLDKASGILYFLVCTGLR